MYTLLKTRASPVFLLKDLLRVGGQLRDVLVVHAEKVKDIDKALAVDADGGLQLDLGLSAPGDAKACSVEHKEIVGAIADGQCLREGDSVLGGDGLEESALVRGVDDGVGRHQFSGQGLGGLVDFELDGMLDWMKRR